MVARRALSIVLCSLLALAACGTDDDDTPAAATTQPPDDAASIDGEPVLRQVLGELDEVPGAPDRTLSLVRYEIAPGAELPVHIHPGVQMAWIESGTLTYTVESGTALVRRADTDTDEALSGPTATDLGPGDADRAGGHGPLRRRPHRRTGGHPGNAAHRVRRGTRGRGRSASTVVPWPVTFALLAQGRLPGHGPGTTVEGFGDVQDLGGVLLTGTRGGGVFE